MSTVTEETILVTLTAEQRLLMPSIAELQQTIASRDEALAARHNTISALEQRVTKLNRALSVWLSAMFVLTLMFVVLLFLDPFFTHRQTIYHDQSEERITLTLPPTINRLLHKVASQRRPDPNGRPPVSALVTEILEKHRGELQSEITGQTHN